MEVLVVGLFHSIKEIYENRWREGNNNRTTSGKGNTQWS